MIGFVGASSASDGDRDGVRVSRDLCLVQNDGRGSRAEASSRLNVFAAMTAPAGTTVVAANVTPIAAAAASIITVYNPPNSGVRVEVLSAWFSLISGTPPAGGFVYNVAYNQNISAVPNNGGTAGIRPRCCFSGGATSQALVYTQTALTGGIGSQILLRPVPMISFAAALAAGRRTSFNDNAMSDVVLPPGALISLAAPALGTTVVMAAGFMFQETRTLSPTG